MRPSVWIREPGDAYERMGANQSRQAERPASSADEPSGYDRPPDCFFRRESGPSSAIPRRAHDGYRPQDIYDHPSLSRDNFQPRRVSNTTRSSPNTRKSFKRSRRGSSPLLRDRRNGSVSPELVHSRHKPSPKRRRISGTWQSSPPLESPLSPDESRVDGSARPMTLYRNPTWTKQPTTQAAPLKHKPKATTEVNGVKDVPTGPSLWCYPPVDDAVKRLPHIFISAEHVPANPKTRRHLRRMLIKYPPQDVLMDDTGWFLTFPDTSQGRFLLKMCEKKYGNQELFGDYLIKMQTFEDGVAQGSNLLSRSHSVANSVANSAKVTSSAAEAASLVQQVEAHTSDDSTQITNADDAGRNAEQQTPTLQHIKAPEAPLTSPATSRLDRDDSASSISGLSSSTGTRSCHVCKGRSDSLTKCSTCSRRYHRSCHPRSIPDEKLLDGWQCQRCVRKNVPPKPPVPEKPITVTQHQTVAVWSTNEADLQPGPTSAEVQQEHAGQGHPSLSVTHKKAAEADDPVERSSEDLGPKPMSHQAQLAKPDQDPQNMPLVDKEAGEAEDLVERSFGNLESEAAQPDVRPKKSIFIRKRISIASETQDVLPQERDPTTMKQPDIGEGLADLDFASPVDSVVQAPPTRMSRRAPQPKIVHCSQCQTVKVARHPSGVSLCIQCKRTATETKDAVETKSVALGSSAAGNMASAAAPPDESNGKPVNTSTVERTVPALEQLDVQQQASLSSKALPTQPAVLPSKDLAKETFVLDNATRKAHSLPKTRADSSASSSLTESASDQLLALLSQPQDNDLQHSDSDEPLPGRPRRKKFKKKAFHESLAKTSEPPTPTKRKAGVKRESHTSTAKDRFDLGNSHNRPLGTYLRLFALALCDTSTKRLQVVGARKWVAENIPGYTHKEGSWEGGLQSTMIMNVKDPKVAIARRVIWQEGDGGKESSDWFELLPGIEDQLEHWDHNLKRPIPPVDGRTDSQFRKMQIDPQPDAAEEEDIGTPQRKVQHQMNAAVEMDDTPELIDDDASDSEPLAFKSRNRQFGAPVASVAPMASMVSPAKVFDDRMEVDTASPSIKSPQQPRMIADGGFTMPIPSPVEPVVATSECDEAYLLSLVNKIAKSQRASHTSFHKVWPEYRSETALPGRAQVENAASRSSQKKLFGKPPVLSELPHDSSTSLAVEHNRNNEVLEDNTVQIPCNSLHEFFDLKEPLIPVLADRHLAFRPADSRRRQVYKLDFL